MTVLLAAHGTRDAEGRRTVAAIAAALAVRLPDASIRLGWLEHARPSVAELLASGGVGRVVPLLLGDGFHVRQDLAEHVGQARGCALSRGIGPGPEVTAALADRLVEAGWRPGVPVVLAAAGSAVVGWRESVDHSARLLAEGLGIEVRAGFLSGPGESVTRALAALAASTGQPPAVAAYLLAPGLFARRLSSLAPGICAAPLGPHPQLVGLLARHCG